MAENFVLKPHRGLYLRLARLGYSILAEGLHGLFHLILFPFQRRAERARIRSVIVGRGSLQAVLLAAALVAFAGCQEPRRGGLGPQPGGSFSRQIENLEWSVVELFSMRDWSESLLEDLQTLGDPELDQLPETFELLGW
ncbi:MAG TPA: hypothetical protein VMT52_06695 [Planctomycetota bacterium]|nr:hypothetical protein [Planctomycetota bacterium]